MNNNVKLIYILIESNLNKKVNPILFTIKPNTHRYIHTYIHTYIHIHIHIYN